MTNDSGRPDILRFVILVIIIVVTLIVIALLRPIIFDRIVPAILGGPEAPVVIDEPDNAGTGGLDEGEVEEPAPAAPTEEPEAKATPINVDDSPDDTIPVGDPAAEEEVFPTAKPAVRHTVQPGETVAQLASRYGVSVDLIAQANQLADVNRITVGMELLIPQP